MLFALIMSRRSAANHEAGASIGDAQQTTAGASQLHDVDLASTFPATKIKAQILRDEGVGRISSKAIQLIGACSAIVVRELAEASASARENKHDDGDDESSSLLLSSKVRVETKGRKRKLSSHNKHQSNSDGNTTESILTRDNIKDCIEQDTTKFDFLHGVLCDHISAKEIPSYGAAYQKKMRREATGNKQKKKLKANDSLGGGINSKNDATATAAADVGASTVLGSATTGTTEAASATSAGDEEALRAVIGASLQEDDDFVGPDAGIVEDDEEYD